ncbi:hypothetical protein [Desulfosporosinus sp. OT]|uniref:hypothetical protein n=1 Tax=Desulfosporosinus sp. OT TaxID=913865 RepID=UPI000223A076|nr:hypothetical protein [Desulfosporosinus sp. OT]EGW36656.1 hypothetical protein DOT_5521 [Desulfosporosinus sp. OT]
MKVLMKPIEMIAWFDLDGPRPIRFRVNGEVYKVHQVSNISEVKLAGNRMKIFRCQSEIGGQPTIFFK